MNKDRRFLQWPILTTALVVCLHTAPVLARQTQSLVPVMQEQPGEPEVGLQPQNSPDQSPKNIESSTQSGTSKDRLFWTLPNFLTVENAKQVPPLTAKKKFKIVLRSSFDPVEFPYVGFLAGIGQAQNSEPGFGQGAGGYLKRFGASFADNLDENLWTAAILPSVFHQDPRYYQLGSGGFLHRICYAMSRQVITRGDTGRTEFNLSEVFGSATAAGISNLYHPTEDRSVANTMSVWGTQVGWDTVSSIVKEFWPDIRRALSRH